MSKKLKHLSVDENMKFDVPSLIPGIIRTGTVGEGSCFFHSILKGIDKNYSQMSPSEKRNYMVVYRKYLSDLFTKEYYINNLNNTSMIYLTDKLNSVFQNLYLFIENPETYLSKGPYQNLFGKIIKESIIAFIIMKNVIPYSHLDKKIMENSQVLKSETVNQYKQEFTVKFIEDFRKEIENIGINIDEEKIQICISKIETLFDFIFTTIINKGYESYKKDIENVGCWGGDEMLSITSDIIDKDIYFIDINKREIYNRGCDKTVSGKRNAVIIGWLGESHFESIGYSATGKTSDIIREFPPDHPLILKIREIIC